MAKNKEKKSTSPVFLGAVVAIMLVVFAIQMIFPTSLGTAWDKLTEHAVKITVTNTEGESWYTASTEEIMSFGNWADGVSMRNKSVANRLTPEKPLEYSFAIESMDGTYLDMIIDGKGYVQNGAKVYMIAGDAKDFLQELEAQLNLWTDTKTA